VQHRAGTHRGADGVDGTPFSAFSVVVELVGQGQEVPREFDPRVLLGIVRLVGVAGRRSVPAGVETHQSSAAGRDSAPIEHPDPFQLPTVKWHAVGEDH
jgi:hypothetical protein